MLSLQTWSIPGQSRKMAWEPCQSQTLRTHRQEQSNSRAQPKPVDQSGTADKLALWSSGALTDITTGEAQSSQEVLTGNRGGPSCEEELNMRILSLNPRTVLAHGLGRGLQALERSSLCELRNSPARSSFQDHPHAVGVRASWIGKGQQRQRKKGPRKETEGGNFHERAAIYLSTAATQQKRELCQVGTRLVLKVQER